MPMVAKKSGGGEPQRALDRGASRPAVASLRRRVRCCRRPRPWRRMTSPPKRRRPAVGAAAVVDSSQQPRSRARHVGVDRCGIEKRAVSTPPDSKPRREPVERDGAADQEAGAEQQHQRQRDLGDDQADPHAVAQAAAGRAAPPSRRPDLHIGPRQPQRRRQPAQHAADEREADGERPARPDRCAPARPAARGGLHAISACVAQAANTTPTPAAPSASTALSVSNWRTMRRVAGAERGAHGNLAAACRAARQQQVTDVAAGNQQNDRDGAEQHQQSRTIVADEILAQTAASRNVSVRAVLREIVTDAQRRPSRARRRSCSR